MTKSSEEIQQEERQLRKAQQENQAQKDQSALARNTQSNAGVPNQANVPPQQTTTTAPNAAVAAQAQKDQLAQGTIQQNIKGDQEAMQKNENLTLLKRIVGQANPVVEDVSETEEQKDADGNVIQVPVTKKVTTGYTYYAVDGKPFDQWVQETFNGEISVDQQNNKIIYNNQNQ